jgi:hypothetical protein
MSRATTIFFGSLIIAHAALLIGYFEYRDSREQRARTAAERLAAAQNTMKALIDLCELRREEVLSAVRQHRSAKAPAVTFAINNYVATARLLCEAANEAARIEGKKEVDVDTHVANAKRNIEQEIAGWGEALERTK